MPGGNVELNWIECLVVRMPGGWMNAWLECLLAFGIRMLVIWHLAFGIWHLAFDIWYLVFGIWHIEVKFWGQFVNYWEQLGHFDVQIENVLGTEYFENILGTEYFENIFDEQIFLGTFLETILGTNILWIFWEYFGNKCFRNILVSILGTFLETILMNKYFVNTLGTISSEVGWLPSNRTEAQQIGP